MRWVKLWAALVVALILLSACGGVVVDEPATRQPDGALALAQSAATPTPFLERVEAYYSDGSVQTWYQAGPVATPTPDETDTPAPTITPTPTVTPSPTPPPQPTATSTHTPVPEPSPTAESTLLPTVEPGPDKRCTLRLDQGGIRIRSAPDTTTGEVVGSLELGAEVEFDQFKYGGPYLWGRHARGWSALYIWASKVWWVAGTQAAELCQDVEGWPEELEPPPAFAWEPPDNPRGVHLLPGANCNLLLNNMGRFGTIKGISGTETCMVFIDALYPDTFLVWRNWVRDIYGAGDGPPGWGQGDPVAVANAWWNAEYATWVRLGLIQADRTRYEDDIVDLLEYRNELGFVGEWEVQFDLQILRRATAANVCLGVFSDGYGNPTIAQFNQRTPVLDYMVDHECQPGRRHIIADHSYSRYDSGPWLFGRWKLQRDTLRGIHGPKYDVLHWIFTEFGVPNTQGEYDGRGVPDCARTAVELAIVEDIFDDAPEIAGYHIFAMGSPGWLDFTPCLS